MVFSQTHDWISTKPTTVGNCTHCSISHSEEIKYTGDTSEKQDKIPKNKPKKKKSRKEKLKIKGGSLVRVKFSSDNFTN